MSILERLTKVGNLLGGDEDLSTLAETGDYAVSWVSTRFILAGALRSLLHLHSRWYLARGDMTWGWPAMKASTKVIS